MKYLCLIYDDEAVWAGMSEAAIGAVMAEHEAFTSATRAKGQYVSGEALQPVATGTIVRVRNGKTTTTDGPLVETKEQLGGFYLIDATDLNEAIAVAAKIPEARTGTIEVRPVMDFSQQP